MTQMFSRLFAGLADRRGKDPARLGAFLQTRGAYIAQRSVLDYCRVKARRNEAQVFADPGFQAALLHCRWQVFFATLADVTALIEAWLRPHAAGREEALAMSLVALHHEALAAEPAPPGEAEDAAAAVRALPGHVAALRLAAPWPAHRLPLLAEPVLFATLPVHADQRVGESAAIRGGLRFLMVATQQELERGFEPEGLAARLTAG